jgi:acyl carrier protein
MIANAQSEIQIVDTHESLETLINVDVAAGTSQFNRTLVMQDNQKPTASSTADLQREVAELMIVGLNMEITADQIIPDAPLYGEGLGLDSIDVLEVALLVSKRYGLQLRTDSADSQHIFSSLRSLSDYIAAKRTC